MCPNDVVFVFLIQILCQQCPLSLGQGRWWRPTALLGVSVVYSVYSVYICVHVQYVLLLRSGAW